MQLPRMMRIRQSFDTPRLDDVAETVERELQKLDLTQTIAPGASVAITAGSRGIANIAVIIRAIAEHVRRLGAEPFIVPAMGSHGGGTAEGQRKILEEYGITEAFTGAEIRSSMETVVVAETPQGIPVHFDQQAAGADHVIVCGRVKPHTGFAGPIESGLHKMMLIGLGKHNGAYVYHRAIQGHSFMEIIQAVAQIVLQRCRVAAGVAIVENALDETALIEAVAPADFFEREQALLQLARKWMPRLPFEACDLLIVDRIGKNISGTGMDTNVIGRKFASRGALSEVGRDDVHCKRVLVRGLTVETHGNACGIGFADFATQACANQIDDGITRVNCITAGHPEAGMLPLIYPNDREALEAALQTIGMVEPSAARVIQIRDTLHLSEVLISEAYAAELDNRPDLTALSGLQPMEFDESAELQAASPSNV